jgi:hypothetical protein
VAALVIRVVGQFDCGRVPGVENGFSDILAGCRKKPWKLIAYIEGPDGKSGPQEYFLVRDVDRYAAIATLLKSRPDLGKSRVEVKGGASPDFLDWI